MSTPIRSRRAGLKPEEVTDRPFYARVLGLQYLRPSGMLCFFFFEGAIALATLLALAELVTWWAVVVLPASIAVMVKINDVIAGFGARAAARARGRAAVRSAAREAARRRAPAPAARPVSSAPAGPTARIPAVPVAHVSVAEGPVAHVPVERPIGRAAVPRPPQSIPLPQVLAEEDELRSVEARRRQSAAYRHD